MSGRLLPNSKYSDRYALTEALLPLIRDELVGDQPEHIDPDENLLTGGLVDSVGLMRLIAHLEDRVDVNVPPKDLIPDNFRTVRLMATYLQDLLAS